MSLLAEMAALLPGSRLSKAGNASRLVFEVDGCWLDARARDMPVIEVFIRTLAIDGFELRIEPSDRSIDLAVERHVGPDGFGYYRDDEVAAALAAAYPQLTFAHYDVDHRNDEIATHWLDEPARAALVEALWLLPDPGVFRMTAVPNGYRFLVERGEVLVRRENETDPGCLARAVRAGGMLAARPHRMARAWLEVARGLGGTTTNDRWDLGKDFALTIERSPVTVRIDNLGGPLRTRARAVRLGATEADDPWAPVASLLATAAPDGRSLSSGEVELRWKGLMMDPARLGPAVEICARLAAPSIRATGPYR